MKISAAVAQQKDGIALLFADHQRFRNLFKEYESTTEPAAKRAIVESLIREIVPHASAEERHVYPLLKALPHGQTVTDRHYLDDTVNLELMEFLEKMDPLADWGLYDRYGSAAPLGRGCRVRPLRA